MKCGHDRKDHTEKMWRPVINTAPCYLLFISNIHGAFEVIFVGGIAYLELLPFLAYLMFFSFSH